MNFRIKLSLSIIVVVLIFTSCKDTIIEKEPLKEYIELSLLQFDHAKDFKIERRNFIQIKCKADSVLINDHLFQKNNIKSEIKSTILGKNSIITEPEKEEVYFPEIGNTKVLKLLIVGFNIDKNVSYGNYFEIREEVFKAFKELQEEFAIANYNRPLEEILNSKSNADKRRLSRIKQTFKFFHYEYQDK